ncbi:tonB family domain-containing protein [Clostridium sp. CAG:632]|nr:tonB family domain-containing protein [Clostridium sp. CAG:632]
MNRNKAKCERLKQIRKQLADRIGVDLHQSECTYRGECKGTCPKCAHEEKQLNQALAAKGMLVAGLATLSLGLAGCGNQYGDLEGEIETIGSESTEMISTESTDITEAGTEEVIELEGDVVYEPDSEF